MDDADITGERAEQYHADALARSRKPAGPEATGRCHWCDEIVGDTHRWCPDTDCRDQWEKEQRLIARGRA
jgi:hypothetical protein